MSKTNRKVYYGEMYWCNLGATIGSVEHGYRPCVIISNYKCNRYSDVRTVIPISSKIEKKLRTHVPVNCKKKSIALVEQITTISVEQLHDYIGTLDKNEIKALRKAILTQVNCKYKKGKVKKWIANVVKFVG